MSQYLRIPQLPHGTITEVAIGEAYMPILAESLVKRGIQVLTVPSCSDLDPRVSSHADLLLVHLGGEHFAVRERCIPCNFSPAYNKVPSNIEEGALNLCLVGKSVILCRKTAFSVPQGYEPIYVRQKYTRCSCCIVDEHSIITADCGIAAAAEKADLDVLRIVPGYIDLPGYDTGFIGGASFKLAKDQLAFTGSLKSHPDKHRIEAFLFDHSVQPVYLTNKPIFDIGSAVLLREDA